VDFLAPAKAVRTQGTFVSLQVGLRKKKYARHHAPSDLMQNTQDGMQYA